MMATDELALAGTVKRRVLCDELWRWEPCGFGLSAVGVVAGGEVVRGETTRWAMDRQVRLVAGSISLAGILASTVVPKAKWIAGGIGAGLTFSALSNTCAMGNLLARLPYNRTDACDIDGILSELNQAA